MNTNPNNVANDPTIPSTMTNLEENPTTDFTPMTNVAANVNPTLKSGISVNNSANIPSNSIALENKNLRENNQGVTPILRGGRLFMKLSSKRRSPRKKSKATRKSKSKKRR